MPDHLPDADRISDECLQGLIDCKLSATQQQDTALALRELKTLRAKYEFIQKHVNAAGDDFCIQLFDLIHGSRDDWDVALAEAMAEHCSDTGAPDQCPPAG